MTSRLPDRDYDAAAVVARHLFGIALGFWFPLAIAAILLLTAPQSPDETYAQIQRFLALAAVFIVALALLVLVRLYRLDDADRLRLAHWLAALFRRRRLALIVLAALVEVNIIALALLPDIAPAITGPFRLLLLCWTLLAIGLALMSNRRECALLYGRIRDPAAVSGLLVLALLLLAAVLLGTQRLAMLSGFPAQLRGSLDYRQLAFIDDGAAPSAREYWAEKGLTRARWLPFSYWTLEPIQGDFININQRGLRRTWNPSDGADSPRLYFFGGSTMWGFGARDAYTIPSQISRLLAEADLAAVAQNYAQEGYVSTQDLILFQARLALGDIPDVAVFYHGFNDVYAAYLRGRAGVSLRENQLVSDVKAGRLLRQGQPVVQPPMVREDEFDWNLVATAGDSAADILDRWAGNRRLIRALAAEFDVQALFIWQPALFAKSQLSANEERILRDLERNSPGFIQRYEAVDGLLRQRVHDESWNDIIILTDLFAASEADIFFDLVHIDEIGNQAVAAALLAPISEILIESS